MDFFLPSWKLTVVEEPHKKPTYNQSSTLTLLCNLVTYDFILFDYNPTQGPFGGYHLTHQKWKQRHGGFLATLWVVTWLLLRHIGRTLRSPHTCSQGGGWCRINSLSVFLPTTLVLEYMLKCLLNKASSVSHWRILKSFSVTKSRTWLYWSGGPQRDSFLGCLLLFHMYL